MTQMVSKGSKGQTVRQFMMIIASILIPLTVMVIFILWEDGYLGSYWERWERKGDIKCYAKEGRVTSSSQDVCYVLTLRGIKARERLTEACKAKGKMAESCLQFAVDELTSHLSSVH
jgi:hypothetical protein